jgi:hypothetical protein
MDDVAGPEDQWLERGANSWSAKSGTFHCQEAGVELVSLTWLLRPMAPSGDHQAGVSTLRSGALEPVQGHSDLHARTLPVSPKGSPR